MDTIKEALEAYIQKGFGSLTKNDFEVWIFHQLLQNELKGKSNYHISRFLQIPESKVKRLRYEADLKYVDEDDMAQERKDQLSELLDRAILKRNGTQIQFIVEDPALKRFLDHQLKLKNRFFDSSFNSEIVSLAIEDYEVILDILDTDGEKKESLIRQARQLLNDNQITFQGMLKKFTEAVVDEAGRSVIRIPLSWLGLSNGVIKYFG